MAEVGKRNYQNGKIYCIRNYVDDEIYIGSSCQPLSKRMVWHRDARKKEAKKNFKIYQKMNLIGVENFYIELIENYPCENVEQLTRREGELIRELRPTLNKRIEGRTDKEWREDNKEKLKENKKQYATNNKERILQKAKEYRKENREEINEKSRTRYSENKDSINEKRKVKYQENKETILEKSRQYNEKNKEKIKEKRSVKVYCDCGGRYTLFCKSRHLKSTKHQNYLNNNIENNVQIQKSKCQDR